jgi:hypothetical protein
MQFTEPRQDSHGTRHTFDYTWIVRHDCFGCAQFVLFLRWLHRRVRDEEITRAFVRDVATNHLPHIYSALRAIAARQGIELEETPLVRFLDLNSHRLK